MVTSLCMLTFNILTFNLLNIPQTVKGLHDRFHSYEVVKPVIYNNGKRFRRAYSTKFNQYEHMRSLTVEFHGFGKLFSLNLERNQVLLPNSFSSYVLNKDDSVTKLKKLENCYYHGYVGNNTESSVVMHTCSGINGYIVDNKNEAGFVIEPIKSKNSTKNEHILYRADLLNEKHQHGKCGHEHSNNDENIMDMTKMLHHRQRRAASNDKKYIEVVAVADNAHVKKYGKVGSIERVIEIMNYVDAVYKTLNTRIALIGVVVFDGENQFVVSSSADKTLGAFENYVATKIHGNPEFGYLNPDNSQLISGISFDASLVGLAGVGDICSYTSAAISKDHGSPMITANTVAHELGHNLGFYHNDGCSCPKSPCVMAGTVPYSQVKGFSTCTQNKWTTIVNNGDASCVFDYPDNLYGEAKCGNGYKEKNEECDCGTKTECEINGGIKCCDPITCKLQEEAECATGPCCHQCKFKSKGVLCRAKVNQECDLQEYCVGNSSECPNNFYVQDGKLCDNGNAYCFQGTCKSYTTQCKILWGENAVKAHDACFNNNLRGDEYGNCGEADVDGKFSKCQPSNTVCGKLQCSGKSVSHPLPTFPVIGSNRGRKEVHFSSGSNEIKCVMGKTSLGKDLFDPTIALEGTKCDKDKICISHKCTNTSTLNNIKKCKKPCLNGGVCNNNGNCHCVAGFSCPYCQYPGVGGSVDSGQGCNITTNITDTNNKCNKTTSGGVSQECGGKCENCLTPLIKGLLVLFLLVIPLICFIIYLSYRHRKGIKNKWRRYTTHTKPTRVDKRDQNYNRHTFSSETNLTNQINDPYVKYYSPESSKYTKRPLTPRKSLVPLLTDVQHIAKEGERPVRKDSSSSLIRHNKVSPRMEIVDEVVSPQPGGSKQHDEIPIFHDIDLESPPLARDLKMT